ncbi:MAG: hypothetical protein O3A78_12490, partial [Nitrospinae bacterium]|nr:hypothetical protein [Nitrospinota bacterium]
GTNGNITVDGITAANSNNIAEAVTLNGTKAGSSVTFANSGSSFKTLNVNAASGITLNADLSASGNASLSAGTGITLANGISVSSGGTLSLATTSGIINALGMVTVSSASGITVNSDFTSAGAATFDADSNDDGTGSFTVATGKKVATGNNSLSITGGDIVLTGSLNSGTGTTTLLASKAGTTIGLGAGTGTFSISDAELGRITAGNLVVGDATNGDITVDNVTPANSNNIAGTTTLNATKSSSKVTFANNASTFNALTVNAGNGIAANATVTADTGNMVLNGGTGGITGTGATTLTATAGGLTLNSSLNSTGSASLTAGTGITLANGVNISSGGILSLATTLGDITAQGAVAVSSETGISLNNNFTSAGAATFDADSNDDGTGDFTVATGKTVSTGNNSLSITGGDIVLTGSLDSGTGTTTLLASNGGTIGLGAGAGAFSIDDGELGRITAGNLTVGDNTNGSITVDGVTATNITGTTTLNATKTGSKATFNNNSTFNALTVNADDDVTVSGNLSTGNNALSIKGKDMILTGSLDSGTGTTTLLASNDGTIGLGATAGGLTVDGGELQKITAGNLVVGDATNGDITVDGITALNSAKITGTTMLNATKSTSNVTFANASTFGGPVSLNAGANATVVTNDALTLASSTIGGTLTVNVAGGNGLIVSGNQTVGGPITMTAGNDITLTGGLFTSSASASAVTLSAGGGIFDGDLTGDLDIDAASGGLVVNSVTGFGTTANAIETKVASVDINNTGLGEINIFETDSLNIVNINHSGTGDINVSFLGALTGETNAIAANGTKTFTNRDSGSLFLPEFGKTLSEVSTERTVNITNTLKDNYFFGNQPSPTKGNTVAQMLSGPESGPFVTNVFDENFALIKVAKGSRRAHAGLRGFASFWGPLGTSNTEQVKRPSRESLREEAKLKQERSKKRKAGKRKARPRLKNARVKSVGDTAALPIVQKPRQKQKRGQKQTSSWLGSQFGNFFK